MEALAIVSLTGNILQFASLGLKIISKAHDLKRSSNGSFKEQEDLSLVVQQLEASLDGLSTESELQDVVVQCQEVGSELQTLLTTAQNRNRGAKHLFSSYRMAILSVVKDEKKINALQEHFEAIIRAVGLRLQVMSHHDLREIKAKLAAMDFEGNCTNLNETLVALQEVAASLTVEGLQRASRPATQRSPLLSDFLETLRFRDMDVREEMISKAHARTFEWLLYCDWPAASSYPEKTHNELTSREELRRGLEDNLRRLGVPTQDIARFFRRKLNHDQHESMSLRDWFRSGDGLFWIYGKPGCGKSTMMKAFSQIEIFRSQIERLLHQWSKGKSVIQLKYYFFRAASPIQNSMQGFLMSIIHQLLSQDPSLASKGFNEKQQREAVARAYRMEGSNDAPWNLHELTRAFKSIIQGMNHHLIFFIDGIDELGDAQTSDQSSIDLCEAISSIIIDLSSDFKVLVASRSTPEFEAFFRGANGLRIHDATDLDIANFAFDKLSSDDFAKVLQHPSSILQALEEITKAAEGGFLWVRMVLESALRGQRRYESFQEFMDHFRTYPKGLDALYNHILSRIEPEHSRIAHFWIVTIALNTKEHNTESRTSFRANCILECFNIANLRLKDIRLIMELSIEPDDSTQPSQKSDKILRQRMSMQSPHVFEFVKLTSSASESVLLFHRSFYDYLKRNSRLEKMLQFFDADSNPVIGYHKYVLQYRLSGRYKYERCITAEKYLSHIHLHALCSDDVTCLALWNFFAAKEYSTQSISTADLRDYRVQADRYGSTGDTVWSGDVATGWMFPTPGARFRYLNVMDRLTCFERMCFMLKVPASLDCLLKHLNVSEWGLRLTMVLRWVTKSLSTQQQIKDWLIGSPEYVSLSFTWCPEILKASHARRIQQFYDGEVNSTAKPCLFCTLCQGFWHFCKFEACSILRHDICHTKSEVASPASDVRGKSPIKCVLEGLMRWLTVLAVFREVNCPTKGHIHQVHADLNTLDNHTDVGEGKWLESIAQDLTDFISSGDVPLRRIWNRFVCVYECLYSQYEYYYARADWSIDPIQFDSRGLIYYLGTPSVCTSSSHLPLSLPTLSLEKDGNGPDAVSPHPILRWIKRESIPGQHCSDPVKVRRWNADAQDVVRPATTQVDNSGWGVLLRGRPVRSSTPTLPLPSNDP